MEDILYNAALISILQIIAIDIVLGGDNAIVIALACKNLPEKQRKLGIFYGALGAIVLRVIMVFFATTLLITHMGLLIWETKHVSLSLAFPGVMPAKPSTDNFQE